MTAAALAAAAPSPDFGKLPLHFEANRGQTDARVRYLARSADRTLFLTDEGAVVSAGGAAVRLRWRHANRHPAIEGVDRQAGVSNYFGRQRTTGIPQFARVRYRDVWPGIDVVFYGSGAQLEYDFLVAPGADPRKIRLEFEGAEARREGGDVVLRTAAGELRQHAPAIFQGARRVPGGYVLRGRQVGFELAAYDRTRPLVIDPVLTYNARFGARPVPPIPNSQGLNGLDRGGTGIVVDAAGNAYVVGSAYTADFPSTSGVFQPVMHSANVPANFLQPNDVFIMKLNPTGTALVFSTFLGGTGDDLGNGIALDPDGNIYVTGTTASADFPVTPGALQQVLPQPGIMSGFAAKINPDATRLLYATFLGGSAGATDARAIAIDDARNMYVTGVTLARNFPVTAGAFQTNSPQFIPCAFVTKINASGESLAYSTFIGTAGGNFNSAPPPLATVSIAVDAAGSAIIAGATNDRNFPTTSGSFQPAQKGGPQTAVTNGFVTKLNPTGSGLVFSTFLGGSFSDGVDALALGPDGSIYVTGHANSMDFPTTSGAFMTGPNPEFPVVGFPRYPGYGFVSRLKPDGSGLLYSTYIGGGGAIIMGAIAVDARGNAYVAGAADSTSFPTTPGALQPCLGDPNGFSNAILFELDPSGSRLLYSTFLGGNVRDQGFGIALDKAANAYVTGMSDSTTFAPTPGAAGIATGQAFIAKVGFSTPTPPGVTCVANTASMVPGPVAAGEIVSIFGTGLGPANAIGGTVANGAFTTAAGGTRVLFDGVAGPLLMVSGNQVNAIVPSTVRFRAQTVIQVEVGGKLLPPQTFDVALSSPAMFTLNGTGTGWAAALNQDGTINSPSNPAARGSIITLFANSAAPWQVAMGDGLVLNDAHPVGTGLSNVTLGTFGQIVYLGNSPGSVTALWQMNVIVPQALIGGTLTVKLTGPNNLTQRATITIR